MEFTAQELKPFGETILEMSVPTQLSYKTPLVYRIVKELSSRSYLPWTGSHRAELCLDEAITNAMIHGNRMDPEKKVQITVCGDEERWGVIVEDEGDGFGQEQVPDPDAPDFALSESGRGILLMDAYVDQLQYSEKGNRLLMQRKRQEEPDAVEAMAAVGGVEESPVEEGEGELVGVSHESGIQIVEIRAARVDDSNVEPLRARLRELAARSPEVVLDLNRIEYISSVGISALVSLFKRIRSNSGHMVLAALQESVRDILDSAYLLRLFKALPDREQAVAELKKQIQSAPEQESASDEG